MTVHLWDTRAHLLPHQQICRIRYMVVAPHPPPTKSSASILFLISSLGVEHWL